MSSSGGESHYRDEVRGAKLTSLNEDLHLGCCCGVLSLCVCVNGSIEGLFGQHDGRVLRVRLGCV